MLHPSDEQSQSYFDTFTRRRNVTSSHLSHSSGIGQNNNNNTVNNPPPPRLRSSSVSPERARDPLRTSTSNLPNSNRNSMNTSQTIANPKSLSAPLTNTFSTKSILTDRSTYMSYLESQLDRVTSSLLLSDTLRQDVLGLSDRVGDVEVKVGNVGKVGRVSHSFFERGVKVVEVRLGGLEGRVGVIEGYLKRFNEEEDDDEDGGEDEDDILIGNEEPRRKRSKQTQVQIQLQSQIQAYESLQTLISSLQKTQDASTSLTKEEMLKLQRRVLSVDAKVAENKGEEQGRNDETNQLIIAMEERFNSRLDEIQNENNTNTNALTKDYQNQIDTITKNHELSTIENKNEITKLSHELKMSENRCLQALGVQGDIVQEQLRGFIRSGNSNSAVSGGSGGKGGGAKIMSGGPGWSNDTWNSHSNDTSNDTSRGGRSASNKDLEGLFDDIDHLTEQVLQHKRVLKVHSDFIDNPNNSKKQGNYEQQQDNSDNSDNDTISRVEKLETSTKQIQKIANEWSTGWKLFASDLGTNVLTTISELEKKIGVNVSDVERRSDVILGQLKNDIADGDRKMNESDTKFTNRMNKLEESITESEDSRTNSSVALESLESSMLNYSLSKDAIIKLVADKVLEGVDDSKRDILGIVEGAIKSSQSRDKDDDDDDNDKENRRSRKSGERRHGSRSRSSRSRHGHRHRRYDSNERNRESASDKYNPNDKYFPLKQYQTHPITTQHQRQQQQQQQQQLNYNHEEQGLSNFLTNTLTFNDKEEISQINAGSDRTTPPEKDAIAKSKSKKSSKSKTSKKSKSKNVQNSDDDDDDDDDKDDDDNSSSSDQELYKNIVYRKTASGARILNPNNITPNPRKLKVKIKPNTAGTVAGVGVGSNSKKGGGEGHWIPPKNVSQFNSNIGLGVAKDNVRRSYEFQSGGNGIVKAGNNIGRSYDFQGGGIPKTFNMSGSGVVDKGSSTKSARTIDSSTIATMEKSRRSAK